MTFELPDNDRWDQVTTTAGQTALTSDFPIFDQTKLGITLTRDGEDTPLALGDDYTVANVGNESGFDVTLVTPAEEGDIYTLDGRTTVESVDGRFSTAGNFDAEAVNRGYDILRMAEQERRRDSLRVLRQPITDTAPMAELPSKDARGNSGDGSLLGFDGDGDPMPVHVSPTDLEDLAEAIDEVETLAGEVTEDREATEAARDAAQAAAANAINATTNLKFTTVDEMEGYSSEELVNGMECFVGSTFTIGGKGYGRWIWLAASDKTPNGITIAKPDDIGAGDGRWHRQFGSFVDFAWWDPDPTETNDCAAAVLDAWSALQTLPFGGTLLVPSGRFKIASSCQFTGLNPDGALWNSHPPQWAGIQLGMVGMGERGSAFVSHLSDAEDMFLFGDGAHNIARGVMLDKLGFLGATSYNATDQLYYSNSAETALVNLNFCKDARLSNLLFGAGAHTQLYVGCPQDVHGRDIEFLGDNKNTRYGIRLGVDLAGQSGQASQFANLTVRNFRNADGVCAGIFSEVGAEHTFSGKLIETCLVGAYIKSSLTHLKDFSWESSVPGDEGIHVEAVDAEISGWTVAGLDNATPSPNSYVWLRTTGSYSGLDVHHNSMIDAPNATIVYFTADEGNKASKFTDNRNFKAQTHISIATGAEGRIHVKDNITTSTTPGSDTIAISGASTPFIANLKRVVLSGSGTVAQVTGACPGELYEIVIDGNQTLVNGSTLKNISGNITAAGSYLYRASPPTTSSAVPVLHQITQG